MSYSNDADFQAYCAAQGYDISELAAPDIAGLRAQASRYIDGLGLKTLETGHSITLWPGEPTSPGQLNEWPRTGATDAYDNEIGDTEVPDRLVAAVHEAAFALFSGTDLNRSQAPDQVVLREKVDVIETQYSDPTKSGHMMDNTVRIQAVETLLAPLLVGTKNYGITGVAV